LYRIVQESTRNALSHGHPRRIAMELEYHHDSVLVCVSDDGDGFDTADPALRAPGHWGLITMKERAAMVGGSITVRSRQGEGTTVEIVVPLDAEADVA
jgi:signal transduction histidine kinase